MFLVVTHILPQPSLDPLQIFITRVDVFIHTSAPALSALPSTLAPHRCYSSFSSRELCSYKLRLRLRPYSRYVAAFVAQFAPAHGYYGPIFPANGANPSLRPSDPFYLRSQISFQVGWTSKRIMQLFAARRLQQVRRGKDTNAVHAETMILQNLADFLIHFYLVFVVDLALSRPPIQPELFCDLESMRFNFDFASLDSPCKSVSIHSPIEKSFPGLGLQTRLTLEAANPMLHQPPTRIQSRLRPSSLIILETTYFAHISLDLLGWSPVLNPSLSAHRILRIFIIALAPPKLREHSYMIALQDFNQSAPPSNAGPHRGTTQ
ncbi:hypothetical protein B0H17DRAFT_1130351 [Mycena rosella]|uniref:Uncharacterized protein n=1 Tax=Mycena rosella TaxID=1033263 RepID=A0AAD7DRH2_MYCRO|nr:hypothetical protein B0H17DRAFT_1130351 [Mycena rosella]